MRPNKWTTRAAMRRRSCYDTDFLIKINDHAHAKTKSPHNRYCRAASHTQHNPVYQVKCVNIDDAVKKKDPALYEAPVSQADRDYIDDAVKQDVSALYEVPLFQADREYIDEVVKK